jgi:hypothetical protein
MKPPFVSFRAFSKKSLSNLTEISSLDKKTTTIFRNSGRYWMKREGKVWQMRVRFNKCRKC